MVTIFCTRSPMTAVQHIRYFRRDNYFLLAPLCWRTITIHLRTMLSISGINNDCVSTGRLPKLTKASISNIWKSTVKLLHFIISPFFCDSKTHVSRRTVINTHRYSLKIFQSRYAHERCLMNQYSIHSIWVRLWSPRNTSHAILQWCISHR